MHSFPPLEANESATSSLSPSSSRESPFQAIFPRLSSSRPLPAFAERASRCQLTGSHSVEAAMEQLAREREMAERPSLSGRFSTSRPTIWSVRESRLVGLSYIKPAVETSVSPPSLPRRAWSGQLRPASLDRSGQRLQSSKVSLTHKRAGRPGTALRERLLPDPKLEMVESKVGPAGWKGSSSSSRPSRTSCAR
jgi:hypothetical protein